MTPPSREGYLLKRRAGLATSMDLMGNFDRRYFRLEHGFLFVFENKPTEKVFFGNVTNNDFSF